MTIARDWPTAMVVLASEQLWPNIHGLAYWNTNLRYLFICSTKDPKSAVPAERLESLCQELRKEVWPNLQEVHRPDGIGMQPQEVFALVMNWRNAHPGERWLLNASGGTKLMHDGLLPLVGQEDTEVVYRELKGPWYRFRPGPILETETFHLPADITDGLSVEALIRAQWHLKGATISFGDPGVVIDWRRAIAEGTRTRWNWPAVSNALGLKMKSGPLFEWLIEAICVEMGLTQITRNVKRAPVKVVGAQQGDLQEIDRVVNHAGRLVILDCKLIDEDGEEERGEPITSQIRQAAHTRRDLGGLGADLVLIRPNRVLNGDQRALAEAYGLTVIDRDAGTELFRRLANCLGVTELPRSLCEAEDAMRQAWEKDRVRPFCQDRASTRPTAVAESGESEAVVDLNAYRRLYEGQDWVAWRLCNEVRVWCEVPGALTRHEVEERAEALFGELGYQGTELSGSGKSCTIRVQVRKGGLPRLRTLLESRLRRGLLC